MTCPRCKSDNYVKVGAGRRMCKDCRKTYNGPERQAEADQRLRERIGGGVFQGHSPEHDMTHTVPDGYLMKGASTLYREDGSIAAQWIKSTVDDVRREAAIGSGAAAAMMAMRSGASAGDAVKATCRIDCGSSDPVQMLRLPKKKPARKR